MPRGKVGAVSAEWPLALPERLDRTRSEGGPAKKAGSNVKAVRKRCTAAVARLCCQYRDGQNGNPGLQGGASCTAPLWTTVAERGAAGVATRASSEQPRQVLWESGRHMWRKAPALPSLDSSGLRMASNRSAAVDRGLENRGIGSRQAWKCHATSGAAKQRRVQPTQVTNHESRFTNHDLLGPAGL